MPSPIVFGTDGWRARIGRDLTFDSVARVVDAVAAWSASPANADPGDPFTLPLVHDTRFLSRWTLTINGDRPLVLSSRKVEYYSAAFFLRNPVVGGLGHDEALAERFWVEAIGSFVVPLAAGVERFHAWAFADSRETGLPSEDRL